MPKAKESPVVRNAEGKESPLRREAPYENDGTFLGRKAGGFEEIGLFGQLSSS